MEKEYRHKKTQSNKVTVNTVKYNNSYYYYINMYRQIYTVMEYEKTVTLLQFNASIVIGCYYACYYLLLLLHNRIDFSKTI